jgi:hypothetical protein
MVHQVATAGGHIANHIAAAEADLLECNREFVATGTGDELHRPIICLTASPEDRLVRFEHVPFLRLPPQPRVHYAE